VDDATAAREGVDLGSGRVERDVMREDLEVGGKVCAASVLVSSSITYSTPSVCGGQLSYQS
jgi:hypothetical protein